jgi:predicted secreted Zn-dependent protease
VIKTLRWLAPALAMLLPFEVHAAWQAVEKIETYAVTGQSGAELYGSIGARGPRVAGLARVIAYTNFKLTWTRDYQQRDGACVLVSARPKLIITYTLPKPSGQLSPALAARWDRFFAGVRRHEQAHGEMIKQLVRQIEAVTVGLSVPGDPQCRAIRVEMTRRLAALSQAQRQQSRDFDRVELSEGGAVHQLILDLVNGP